MSTFANLTTADFKQLSKLIEKKEGLLRKLQTIDAALNAFEPGAAPAKAARTISVPSKNPKRAKLKESILAALKEAGDKGHTAGELADKLKVKINNVRVWFYTTGKKVAGLKKSKDGRYSL